MLTIILDKKEEINIVEWIASIDRLSELVDVSAAYSERMSNDKLIYVNDGMINIPLDWIDSGPPYVFPKITNTKNNFLALVFFKLGNHQRAFDFVAKSSDLYHHLLIATNLLYGYVITIEQLAFLNKKSKHNLAVVYNFGFLEATIDEKTLGEAYREAIESASDSSMKLFSAKHYINFLTDTNQLDLVQTQVDQIQAWGNTFEENNTIRQLTAAHLMSKLSFPYDNETLAETLFLQKSCISFYEGKSLFANAGLLLIEASKITNYQKSFDDSKFLIEKAIMYFREENIPELLGEATVQKAIMFSNWSKNDELAYYKPAINSFQDALKVFKRDEYPLKFAEVHHHLAMLYSEIKVTNNEKAIWAAFCASSFKEALMFYTKETYPVEYAMVSHNYATALMGFPEAKIHNNLDKAFDLFEEALAIRTAKDFPFERALTILNQLELYWLINNEDKEDENNKYNDMLSKTNEIFNLVDDKTLLDKAKNHLEELKKLKSIME